jgi:hypothetical protein
MPYKSFGCALDYSVDVTQLSLARCAFLACQRFDVRDNIFDPYSPARLTHSFFKPDSLSISIKLYDLG